MKNRLFFVLPLLIFSILALYLGYALLQQQPIKQPQEMVGAKAPNFSLPSLYDQDKLVKLQDFAGQPLVVNFFASWCAPCRQEHPLLMALHRRNIPIIGIAYRDKPENTRQFLESLGNPYIETLQDNNGRTTISFGISGIPETFFIDGNGQIIFRYAGPLNDAIIRDKIIPLLNENR
ncbi:MAG TPA: DsbE family thiol:disulfide interchange protein [Alphaproteobacteria bacterium]|jgi:cytochrome c biogenesis protein CcmG/thiol:disulfide interchange protein DsbE|nr:DsbE family thiol:disulfide interchange protein [Alphaproteobacteria bacterium]HMS44992.1 DsbE family thiol:disulfide interchange protein [Alphaproteobacteria bacterium]